MLKNRPTIFTLAVSLITIIALAAVPVRAAPGEIEGGAATEVEGLWATGGSLVRVARTGDTLEMVVVALEEPFDELGQPFIDSKNPDKALRTQTILGMDLLSGYEFTGKRWEGKIYDPESGNVYSSRMKRKDGKLEMRGYIGTPMLGKTKKFAPIDTCREDILVMLKNSSISGYCGL